MFRGFGFLVFFGIFWFCSCRLGLEERGDIGDGFGRVWRVIFFEEERFGRIFF